MRIRSLLLFLVGLGMLVIGVRTASALQPSTTRAEMERYGVVVSSDAPDIQIEPIDTMMNGILNGIPAPWRASHGQQPRYEIHVKPVVTTVETCLYRPQGQPFSPAKLTLKRISVAFTISIKDLETKGLVSSRRLTSTQPRPCSTTEQFGSTTAYLVGDLKTDDVAAWLHSTGLSAKLKFPGLRYMVDVPARQMMLSADGKRVIAIGDDLRMYDATNGKLITVLIKFPKQANDWLITGLSADAKLAFSSGVDGTVRIWDVEAQKQLSSLERSAQDVDTTFYAGFRFSANGKYFAGIVLNQTKNHHVIHVWDVTTGKLLSEFELSTSNSRDEFELSPDGKTLITYVQSSIGPSLVGSLSDLSGMQAFIFYLPDLHQIAFSPNNKQLAYIDEHRSLQVVDSQTGKQLTNPGSINASGPLKLRFRDDNRTVIVFSSDQIWSADATADGTLQSQAFVDNSDDYAIRQILELSPSMNWVAARYARFSTNEWITGVSGIGPGNTTLAVLSPAGQYASLVFSQDERTIFLLSDGTLGVWDLVKK